MKKAATIVNFLEKKYITKKPKGQPFLTLIRCILSQRTREENTRLASSALFAVARTPRQILSLPQSELQNLIRPAGFYTQKARNIKAVAGIILKKYKGRVPKTRQELLDLPGVGFKTADVTLAYGHGIPTIAVDTHVSQVSKRLGLARPKDSVESVRERLERIFPKRKWYVINHGMVQFGRDICKPIRPVCVKDKKLCPFSYFCRAYRRKQFNVR